MKLWANSTSRTSFIDASMGCPEETDHLYLRYCQSDQNGHDDDLYQLNYICNQNHLQSVVETTSWCQRGFQTKSHFYRCSCCWISRNPQWLELSSTWGPTCDPAGFWLRSTVSFITITIIIIIIIIIIITIRSTKYYCFFRYVWYEYHFSTCGGFKLVGVAAQQKGLQQFMENFPSTISGMASL